MKRKVCFVLMCLVLLFVGCGKEEKKENQFFIYYVDKDGDKVETDEYESKAVTESATLDELIENLKEPESDKYRSPIPEITSIVKYEWIENQLTVYFDEHYYEMNKKEEVLCRSGIVRTVTQLEGIQYVAFMVGEQPLADNTGNPVGVMSKETFVDDLGNDMGVYQEVSITLYFANKKGDELIEVERDVYRNENVSMEKLVLEQLIKGPGKKEEAYATLPSATKVLSVTVEDGVCYVNFNNGILNQGVDVSDTISIYSIVNSLSEISGVNKVQIAINGETKEAYKNNIPLDQLFERDLDLVQ